MESLRAHMTDAWVNQLPVNKVREARYLLRAMVSLMASTGIAPGLEVETLTPAQVEFRDDHHEQPGLRIVIR